MSNVSLTNYVSIGVQGGEAPLWDAILDVVIDREHPADPNKLLRRVVIGGQMAVSIAAGIAYFRVIAEAGVLYAIGNLGSFCILDAFAVKGSAGESLGPRCGREVLLLKRNSNGKLIDTGLVVGAIGLSVLSVFPIAFPALDSDGILGMLAVLAGGTIVPLYSIKGSFETSIQMMSCVSGAVSKKVQLVRNEVVLLLDRFGSVFEQLGMDKKLGVIDKFSQIRDLDERDRVAAYVSMVLADDGGVVVKRGVVALAREALINFPGALLAASLETALTLYTFDRSKKYITDEDLGAGFFTAVTIGCGVYLNGKSIIGTTARFVNAFMNGLNCRRTKGISEQLSPKLTACLKLLGLTLNIGTFGSSLAVFGEFFKDNRAKQLYFETTICAAYFLLTATATLDLVDSLVKEIVLEKGTPAERKVVLLHKELVQLKRLFTKSSVLDFALFLLRCPLEVRDRLMHKVDISIEELEAFVAPARVAAK